MGFDSFAQQDLDPDKDPELVRSSTLVLNHWDDASKKGWETSSQCFFLGNHPLWIITGAQTEY